MISVEIQVWKNCLLFVVGAVMVRNIRKYVFSFSNVMLFNGIPCLMEVFS